VPQDYLCNVDSPETRLVFVHRVAEDGSIESFCMSCFVTVSRAWTKAHVSERELAEAESSHICQRRVRPSSNDWPSQVSKVGALRGQKEWYKAN
jgi:hypothetical protein